MKKGKLIVIDGIDGSGKETQVKLLGKRLTKLGFKCRIADFPQYGKKSAGLVEEYLNGKYGQANEVKPYAASIFYAADRYDASFKIRQWLKDGCLVLANRYVTANMGHQGGKIRDKRKRKEFYEWLYDLEYNRFAIPRPDLNIILHVEPDIALKLIDKRGKKDYLNSSSTKDIHAKDFKHLKAAEKIFLEICKLFPDIKLIECSENNGILPIPEINDKIWEIIKTAMK